ncbi:MFS transporter [Enterococcus olivae]
MLMLFLSIKFIDEKNSSFGKIDVIGSVVSVIGMVSLVYSISGDSQQLVALIIAIIFMGFFVWFESRTLNPILPLSLFHNKERVGAYIARFTFMGSMLSLWFLTPQFLQNYFGYSPLIAGLAFFPLSFSIFVFSMAVSKLTKKWGNSKLMIVGLFITIIGMFNLMLFNNQSNYWMGIAVPMVIIGMGQGFSLSPLTSSGITQTSGEEAGAASGVVNMVHQIGGSIGLSIIISLTSNIKNIVTQFHYQMMIAAIYIVISFIVAIILIYKKN